MRNAIVLVDLRNLIFRSFFGSGKDGKLYSDLLTKIDGLVRDAHTRHLVFCTDGKYPLWRLHLDESYKQNREQNPDVKEKRKQINQEMPSVIKFIRALGHPLLEVDHIEADDIIGITSERIRRAWKWDVLIVSNDKDYYSLLTPGVVIFRASRFSGNAYADYTMSDFQGEYGITPDLWPHVKALAGDSSDNLKGLHKVGEVKALAAVKAGVRADMTIEELPDDYAKWSDQWHKAQATLKLVTIPKSIYDLPEPYRLSTDKVINSVAAYRHAKPCQSTHQKRVEALQDMAGEFELDRRMIKFYQTAVCGLSFR